MNFDGFDWDDGNREKCTKHGVSIGEIETLFGQSLLILDDPVNSSYEHRFRGVGMSSSGRHIFVVFTFRAGRLRPISARYMHRKEIERYEKDNP